MDKLQFATEFEKLLYSKQTPVERLAIEVYWEDLCDLEYLPETLRECRNRTWYRDFDRSIPRFPETAEIKEVNREICIRNRPKPVMIEEPKQKPSKYFLDKPEGYSRVLSSFCQDCMSYLGLNCGSVWEYCEKNLIDVPMDFEGVSNGVDSFKKEARNLLGEGLKQIKTHKPTGNVGSMLKVQIQ